LKRVAPLNDELAKIGVGLLRWSRLRKMLVKLPPKLRIAAPGAKLLSQAFP
jgi:hypothetical protein